MVQISTPGVTPNREWAPREALFVKLIVLIFVHFNSQTSGLTLQQSHN